MRDFSKENAPLDEQMQHYLDHGSEDEGEEEEAQAAPPPQVLRITRRSGRGEGEAAVASPEVATRAEAAAKPVDRVPTNTDAEVRAIAAQVRVRLRSRRLSSHLPRLRVRASPPQIPTLCCALRASPRRRPRATRAIRSSRRGRCGPSIWGK